MSQLPAPKWICLQVALLLVAAACSSTLKDPPASGGGGDAGGNGGDDTTPSMAGAPHAGSAGHGGAGGVTTEAGAGGVTTEAGAGGAGGAGDGEPELPTTSVYGGSVVSFDAGGGAGYNQDKMPGIVLGPPVGKGSDSGSLDVVSLGARGEIVLAFGELGIVDGPGPDLVVFENSFWPSGDAASVFAELGEVSVSEDGETWQTFPCDSVGDGDGNFPGCAGWTPTLVYDPATLIPLDPALSGGDAFDLADLGLKSARFVKIRDLETLAPGGTTTGFDLDAVGVIHAR